MGECLPYIGTSQVSYKVNSKHLIRCLSREFLYILVQDLRVLESRGGERLEDSPQVFGGQTEHHW